MEKKTNNGLGIAAFVLGIIAVLGSFIPYINIISYVFGFIALILGIVSLVDKKSSNVMPIIAIILAIATFGIATVMNVATTEVLKKTSKEIDKIDKDVDKMTGDSTEEVLKNDVEVTLGGLNTSVDEFGLIDSEMVVTVKNITDKKSSYSLHIEAIDSTGQRINDDYVYVNDLGPGQTTTEKIFQYIEEEKLDAMKNATFKIVEASAY